MSRIQIADLQATGTELFQGNESFLTELQSVEASAIYGGKACGSTKKSKPSGSKIGCSSKNSGGKSSGGAMCPPPVVVVTPPPVVVVVTPPGTGTGAPV
jgi:hypothetical protein